MTNEEHFLIPQIEQVQQNFDPSAEMLADGAMPTGAKSPGTGAAGRGESTQFHRIQLNQHAAELGNE